METGPGASAGESDQHPARVVWIVVMTWISWIGIEISAKLQYLLLGIEVVILGLLAGIALVKVYTGNGVAESAGSSSPGSIR